MYISGSTGDFLNRLHESPTGISDLVKYWNEYTGFQLASGTITKLYGDREFEKKYYSLSTGVYSYGIL